MNRTCFIWVQFRSPLNTLLTCLQQYKPCTFPGFTASLSHLYSVTLRQTRGTANCFFSVTWCGNTLLKIYLECKQHKGGTFKSNRNKPNTISILGEVVEDCRYLGIYLDKRQYQKCCSSTRGDREDCISRKLRSSHVCTKILSPTSLWWRVQPAFQPSPEVAASELMTLRN